MPTIYSVFSQSPLRGPGNEISFPRTKINDFLHKEDAIRHAKTYSQQYANPESTIYVAAVYTGYMTIIFSTNTPKKK